VFEKRVLREICGPKMEEVGGDGENCMRRSLCVLLTGYFG
jgi:hypothetical protein